MVQIDVIRSFVRDGTVRLIPVPTHRFKEYDPSNALLEIVRTEAAADWVSFLDPDEYLTGPEKLKTSLALAWAQGVGAIAVSRSNLTRDGPDSGRGALPDTSNSENSDYGCPGIERSCATILSLDL